jgi:hypothetical protein
MAPLTAKTTTIAIKPHSDNVGTDEIITGNWSGGIGSILYSHKTDLTYL